MQLKESCVIIKFRGWQWGLGIGISWGLLNHLGPTRDPPSQSRKEQHEP